MNHDLFPPPFLSGAVSPPSLPNVVVWRTISVLYLLPTVLAATGSSYLTRREKIHHKYGNQIWCMLDAQLCASRQLFPISCNPWHSELPLSPKYLWTYVSGSGPRDLWSVRHWRATLSSTSRSVTGKHVFTVLKREVDDWWCRRQWPHNTA